MLEQFDFKINDVVSRRSALGLFGLGSVALLAGCRSQGSSDNAKTTPDTGSKKLNIVASFPCMTLQRRLQETMPMLPALYLQVRNLMIGNRQPRT